MVKKILKWIPALFVAGCNFYLSSQEHIEQMPSFWNADKVVHFFCFAGFSFWIAFACNINKFRLIWIPTLIISLWAITDEIHQSFTPSREPSVLDWLADTSGAAVGALIFVWVVTVLWEKIKNMRSKKA